MLAGDMQDRREDGKSQVVVVDKQTQVKTHQCRLRESRTSTTGLPAYSDTGYSDTVIKLSSYSDTFLIPQLDFHTIKLLGYSDTVIVRSSPLTVTLFCRPNTVAVSGEACILF